MKLNAEMTTQMTERFNVAGALLVKLFGRPDEEAADFAGRAGRVRDIGVTIAMANRIFFTALTLVAALATALVYGVGGNLVISGALTVGTLLALAALLGRLYGPLTALSNVRVDVMTALVSFERVFEVLDLEPMVDEKPDAVAVPTGPTHDRVRPRRASATRRPTRSRSPRSSRWRARTRRPCATTCCATSTLHGEPGRDGRPRRPVRCRQDHDHRAGLPALRRHRRRRSRSTATTCAT